MFAGQKHHSLQVQKGAGEGSFCVSSGEGSGPLWQGEDAVVLLMAVLVVCRSLGGGGCWGEGGQWDQGRDLHVAPSQRGWWRQVLREGWLHCCLTWGRPGHGLLWLGVSLKTRELDMGFTSRLRLWKRLLSGIFLMSPQSICG